MSHFGRSGPPDIRDTFSLLVLNISFREETLTLAESLPRGVSLRLIPPLPRPSPPQEQRLTTYTRSSTATARSWTSSFRGIGGEEPRGPEQSVLSFLLRCSVDSF
jgi:hypothetical protein